MGTTTVRKSSTPSSSPHYCSTGNCPGGEGLANLLSNGFVGDVYPVNPSAEEILGVQCHPSVTAINREIDLAVVVPPRPAVAGVIGQCAAERVSAVKPVILLKAGSSDAGELSE